MKLWILDVLLELERLGKFLRNAATKMAYVTNVPLLPYFTVPVQTRQPVPS